MKLWKIAIAFAILYFANVQEAKAYWLLCDTCSTQQEFESVARESSPAIPNSYYIYAVGNTVTGVFYYVEVVFGPRDGDVPASFSGISSQSAESYQQSDPASSVSSVQASTEEMRQFSAIAAIGSDQILFAAPDNTEGFESFLGAEQILVSNALWAAFTAKYPGWQTQALSQGFVDALWNAVQLARGRGPSGCVVFRNGDSACYQLHPADKNAARYIEGTAKDVNGQPLYQTGGIGSGAGLEVHRTPSDNTVEWGRNTSGWWPTYTEWLICGYVGGELQWCYIETR